MSTDWSVSPPLPNFEFNWQAHNPVNREDVNTFFESKPIAKLKEKICHTGQRLWQKDFVDGNGGNISIRVAQNLVLCTPTLISKGSMCPEDMCFVDLEGKQKAGHRPSTSEIKTHLAVMKSIHCNSCVHAHPVHCNAFIFAGLVPPNAINPEADIFLGQIALSPYATPGTPQNAEYVGKAAKHSQVIFMENHGVITAGRHVEEAYWFMENAEAYCRTLLLSTCHNHPVNQLSPESLNDLIGIRKKLGLPIDVDAPLYNMDTYAGKKMGRLKS